MTFKKIAAGAIASALAVSTMAISANAMIYPIPDDVRDPSLDTSSSWLIQLYNVGNPSENKPATNRDLDLQAINTFKFYMELLPNPDPDLGLSLDMYDVSIDGFGGNVIYSANGGAIGSSKESEWYDIDMGVTLFGKYNWPNNNSWWGLPEEGDTPEGQEAGTNQGTVDYAGQAIAMEYVNTFAYKLELNIAEEHADDPDYVWPEGGDCYQVGLQEWGNDATYGLKVDVMVLEDVDGNFLMAFNENGEEITESEANDIIDWLGTREINLSAGPGEDPYDLSGGSDSSDGSDGSDASSNESGDSENNASGDTAEDTTTTTTTTTSATYEASGDNSTLFIILGIVAAVIVVVVIVIVVVSKKKKS